MYEKFYSLSLDKQERIINAALKEFGKFGYKKTSAEQIASEAQISKGMIFHYFGTKLKLYEFLISYSYKYMKKAFSQATIDTSGLDYIEQYKVITKMKLKTYGDNSFIFDFLTMLYLHPENTEISEEVKCYYLKIIELRESILKSMELSASNNDFRDDIDLERIKKYIKWIIEGYSQEIIFKIGGKALSDVNIDYAWDEFDEILDDLKRIFYKKV